MSAVELAFAEDQHSREKNARTATLHQRLCKLTPREREVFSLVVSGLRNKQAAWALGISEITLQIHRTHIMRKMAAASFADLVRMAATLDIFLSESNVEPVKQFGMPKNVVRSYDCSLAGEVVGFRGDTAGKRLLSSCHDQADGSSRTISVSAHRQVSHNP